MQDNEAAEELVTIATFGQPFEAEFARMRLDMEGIRCFVQDANIVGMNALLSVGVGGVKLQVSKSDAARAVEILNKKPVREDNVVDSKDEDYDLRCPNCGSSDIHYEKFSTRAIFLSILLLGLPLPFMSRKWTCNHCGHQWKKK